MSQSLAVKYRPNKFEDVCSQSSIIKILEKQIEKNNFTNTYLFSGPSGCGKTTLARIFANKINNFKGSPIEIDGASNNGVDNIRNIINEANQRSVDSEYKIFIIDECHMLSSAAWNAFLKCIEEPPKYTIFMFCTTNPEKIPVTIQNRLMRFNLTKVDINLIKERLEYICNQEHFINYNEACDFISKLSNGGVRDAISLLEKCAEYNIDLRINNVLDCLGDFSYDSFFNLTGALLNQDEAEVIRCLDNYYNSGKDLKLFIEQYLNFILDLTKYCLFKSMDSIKIPLSLKNRCEGYCQIPNILTYSNNLLEKLLDIKNTIKYDVNNKTTIQIMFISICREL